MKETYVNNTVKNGHYSMGIVQTLSLSQFLIIQKLEGHLVPLFLLSCRTLVYSFGYILLVAFNNSNFSQLDAVLLN